MGSSCASSDGKGFDHDGLGQGGADTQTGIADLADHGAFVGQKSDLLLLAETQFAESNRDFGGIQELFPPATRARWDLAERANKGLRTGIDVDSMGRRLAHGAEARGAEIELQGVTGEGVTLIKAGQLEARLALRSRCSG
jgi:hypothetical protein